jgi:spore cortex formation protein SpoVR/YcgB (stage V sporulation)
MYIPRQAIVRLGWRGTGSRILYQSWNFSMHFCSKNKAFNPGRLRALAFNIVISEKAI